jgi:hypothetical protein
MGKTSGGLDEVSLGANMIRTSCSIINGENGANARIDPCLQTWMFCRKAYLNIYV